VASRAGPGAASPPGIPGDVAKTPGIHIATIAGILWIMPPTIPNISFF